MRLSTPYLCESCGAELEDSTNVRMNRLIPEEEDPYGQARLDLTLDRECGAELHAFVPLTDFVRVAE